MGIDITTLSLSELETLAERLEMTKRKEANNSNKEIIRLRIQDVEKQIADRKKLMYSRREM